MRHVTFAEGLSLLEEIVAEEGNGFVYQTRPGRGPSCHYAFNGEGDCGIGRVLVKLGIPASELEWAGCEGDDSSNPAINPLSSGTAEVVMNQLTRDGRLSFDSDLTALFRTFQYSQDSGETWGESLRIAKATKS